MTHVDIHTHLLPMLDDGPPTVEEALALARQFVAHGTDRLFVTPHGFSPFYHVDAHEIRVALAQFQEHIRAEQIELTLQVGMEIHYHPKIVETILAGDALCLGGTYAADAAKMRYALIELPTREWPKALPEVIYELALRKIQAIIAHPERNLIAQQSDKEMLAALDEGAWMQLTAGSITGQFGQACQRLSKKWISAGHIHLLASDAHDARVRVAGLDQALAKLYEWKLDDAATQCLHHAERVWSAS
ncbi:MAG: hypothetical protein OWR52_01475 [Acidibacillus sp.]|nr:hypothetical protein [Acidibacillus sp.]